MLTWTIMNFILLIDVKISTFIDIIAFISRINTISKSSITRKLFIFQHFSFYEELVFHGKLSWA